VNKKYCLGGGIFAIWKILRGNRGGFGEGERDSLAIIIIAEVTKRF